MAVAVEEVEGGMGSCRWVQADSSHFASHLLVDPFVVVVDQVRA